jgi:hypothetical protein
MKNLKEIDKKILKTREDKIKSINEFIDENLGDIFNYLENDIMDSRYDKKDMLKVCVRSLVTESFPSTLSYKSYEFTDLVKKVRKEIINGLKNAGYDIIVSKVDYSIYIYFDKKKYSKDRLKMYVTNNKWFKPVYRIAALGISLGAIAYCVDCLIDVLGKSILR